MFNIAYNLLCGGCVCRMMNGAATQRHRVPPRTRGAGHPDPTTAGDFCRRRFAEADIQQLMDT
ncbi:MAG: hypothetical protein R3B07_31875 [Polyangiaceae bacterium]